MRVIGIDPGTRLCGWGIVERHGAKVTHVAHGTFRLADGDLADRLVELERGLVAVLAEHVPTAAAIESLFFGKNAQSASKLGHARGVAMMVLRRAGLPIGEYTPARVKSVVVGSGRGEKLQVSRVAALMLGLKELPQADAGDALAIAITHTSGASFAAALGRA
jgi:crossover junction endodeoxyribonuclease RuvC